MSDGPKVLVALSSGARECTEAWAGLLRELRARRIVIEDGRLEIWAALRDVYPETAEQRRWNHRIVSVMDRLPTRVQSHAKSLLTAIAYAETREAAERQKAAFQHWATLRGHDDAARRLDRD